MVVHAQGARTTDRDEMVGKENLSALGSTGLLLGQRRLGFIRSEAKGLGGLILGTRPTYHALHCRLYSLILRKEGEIRRTLQLCAFLALGSKRKRAAV